MTDKVNPSINRPAKAYQTAGAIALAGGAGQGYISSSAEPSDISVQDGDITESNLNAFAETSSSSSFDVNIDGGEAFVFGSWLAIDTVTTVTLTSGTSGQIVYVGWNKDSNDDVIIGLNSAFEDATGDTDERIPLYEYDTDGSGVTNVTDRRTIGEDGNFIEREGFIGDDTLEAGDELTIDADEYMVVGGSYTLNGDATINGNLVTVENEYSHDQLADIDPTDHLLVEQEYQITLNTGSTPAFDGTLTDAFGDQLAAFDVTVTPTNGLNDTYAFNFDDGRVWNNGSWDVPLTVNWDDDPGSDVDVSVRVHRRTN